MLIKIKYKLSVISSLDTRKDSLNQTELIIKIKLPANTARKYVMTGDFKMLEKLHQHRQN